MGKKRTDGVDLDFIKAKARDWKPRKTLNAFERFPLAEAVCVAYAEACRELGRQPDMRGMFECLQEQVPGFDTGEHNIKKLMDMRHPDLMRAPVQGDED